MEHIKPLFKTGTGCYYHLYRCPSGHFFKKRIDSVNKGVSICRECRLEQFEEEASLRRLKFLKNINKDYCEYMDTNGHIFKARPIDIRKGRIPKQRNYGILYCILIRDRDTEFIKIGVSTVSIGKRIQQYGLSREAYFESLYLFVTDIPQEAFKIEAEIKGKIKDFRLDTKAVMKNGFTETYSSSHKQNILNIIRKVIG